MAHGGEPPRGPAMRPRRSTLRPAVLLAAVLAAAALAGRQSSRAFGAQHSLSLLPFRSLGLGRGKVARAAQLEEAAAEPEIVTIEMAEPLDGRIGVAVQGGRRTVSSLKHEKAFALGWRVGDVIVAVNGEPVQDNEAVKAAVKKALVDNLASGTPLSFSVKRRLRKLEDPTRTMLRMTPGTGGGTTVPMKDLLSQLLLDFPVVLFIDGKLGFPNSNLSARGIKVLEETGMAFKAIDCMDEKYNPDVKEAVEELAGGTWDLPQLFVGGKPVGNSWKMEEMAKEDG